MEVQAALNGARHLGDHLAVHVKEHLRGDRVADRFDLRPPPLLRVRPLQPLLLLLRLARFKGINEHRPEEVHQKEGADKDKCDKIKGVGNGVVLLWRLAAPRAVDAGVHDGAPLFCRRYEAEALERKLGIVKVAAYCDPRKAIRLTLSASANESIVIAVVTTNHIESAVAGPKFTAEQHHAGACEA